MATQDLERAYEALDRALDSAEELPALLSAAMNAKEALARRGIRAGMGGEELAKHHRKLGRCVEGACDAALRDRPRPAPARPDAAPRPG